MMLFFYSSHFKRDYMKRRPIKRMDHAVYTLLKCIHDKNQKVIKLLQGHGIPNSVRTIRENHFNSDKLNIDDYTFNRILPNTFQLIRVSQNNQKQTPFTIRRGKVSYTYYMFILKIMPIF